MKVYQFELRVVIADDVEEGALLTRVAHFALACGGDPLAKPPARAEARAVLIDSLRCGADPSGHAQWTRQALDVLLKRSSTDVFADHRVKR